MSTTDTAPGLDSALADAEIVLRFVAEGKRVTDPELIRRVRERAERITDEVYRTHGLLDVAVDVVREGRDE
jgi:hypothetical protein